MKIVSFRIPENWLEWINARFKFSKFVRDAILQKMWDYGFDKDRKESLSDE